MDVTLNIESIEIDINHSPRHLKFLSFYGNNNADDCREVAKLLQGGDSTLRTLILNNNKIDKTKELKFLSMPYKAIHTKGLRCTD